MVAYTIRKSDGNVLMTVQDNTVNETVSLEIPGRGVASYGRIVGENFIHLLENFANAEPPTGNLLAGQLWFDTANDEIMLYNGSDFRSISGAGDMFGSNNLSDVTNIATSRANLGLGDAAVRNIGSADDEVPIMSALGSVVTYDVGTGSGQIPTNNMISSDNVYGFAKVANNLSDLQDVGLARTNLNLGDVATRNVGTEPGEIPANSDLGSAAYRSIGTGSENVPINSQFGTAASRNIGTAADQIPLNSDLGTAATRDVGTGSENLPRNADLGTAATYAVGTGSEQLPTNAMITSGAFGYLVATNNLSDVADVATARSNLSLGTAATYTVGTADGELPTNAMISSGAAGYLRAAENLSDVADVETARTNLGLGSAATRNIGLGVNDVPTNGSIFPTGTRMVFAQAAAPAGWTQVTSLNDRVLRVVSTAGGGVGGSWTISGLATGAHTLTESEMPTHRHFMWGDTLQYDNLEVIDATSTAAFRHDTGSSREDYHIKKSPTPTDPAVWGLTSPTGGGQGHSHTVTSGDAWRPSYLDVIIAAKD